MLNCTNKTATKYTDISVTIWIMKLYTNVIVKAGLGTGYFGTWHFPEEFVTLERILHLILLQEILKLVTILYSCTVSRVSWS